MMWHNVLRHHTIAINCIIIFCHFVLQKKKEQSTWALIWLILKHKTEWWWLIFWRNGCVRNTYEVLRKIPLKIIRMWAINTLSSLSNVAEDWKSHKMDTLLKNLLNVEINIRGIDLVRTTHAVKGERVSSHS